MQPPSGGCVLKRVGAPTLANSCPQPPSGGCVLKHFADMHDNIYRIAATFGWLCVETIASLKKEIWMKSSHLRVAVC